MTWPVGRSRVYDLVAEHYAPVYRFAYRLSGKPDLAADLTQEAFCRAQENWGQLRDPDRPLPWLFSIVRNCYLRKCRDDRARKTVAFSEEFDWPEPVADEPIGEIDPCDLQKALDDLPENYRTPLILFYFEEFSYREIADQMGVALGTVMSRLARAKQHLRKRLETVISTGGAP
ncbi:MAG: RNA polymerase sigma factor [Gemmataceae bacterium]|nr:RNA polymerase sigma factor [Gemmataceae bacterium]